MIAEVKRSTSFVESAEYVFNLKPEDRELSPEELAKRYPSHPATPDAPAWEAGRRHRIIGGNLSGETERETVREMTAVRNLRPDIKNTLLCISIRKAPGDEVTGGSGVKLRLASSKNSDSKAALTSSCSTATKTITFTYSSRLSGSTAKSSPIRRASRKSSACCASPRANMASCGW